MHHYLFNLFSFFFFLERLSCLRSCQNELVDLLKQMSKDCVLSWSNLSILHYVIMELAILVIIIWLRDSIITKYIIRCRLTCSSRSGVSRGPISGSSPGYTLPKLRAACIHFFINTDDILLALEGSRDGVMASAYSSIVTSNGCMLYALHIYCCNMIVIWSSYVSVKTCFIFKFS